MSCLFLLPISSYDESTQKRQAYVQASICWPRRNMSWLISHEALPVACDVQSVLDADGSWTGARKGDGNYNIWHRHLAKFACEFTLDFSFHNLIQLPPYNDDSLLHYHDGQHKDFKLMTTACDRAFNLIPLCSHDFRSVASFGIITLTFAEVQGSFSAAHVPVAALVPHRPKCNSKSC